MKTIAILILVLIITFGFAQKLSHGQEMPAFSTNNTVNVNGNNLVIQYGITGGKLLSVNTDIPSKSLIISIQSIGDGKLTISLPRTLIDAKQNGDDTHFTILVNNHGTNYDEIESYSHSTLSIPFHLGAEKIQIIGTQMLVPNSISAKSPQVIEAPYTDTPPDIDGKWTMPSEWNKTNAISVEGNGSEMYILAQHDSNFAYVMADIVSDHTTPSSYPFMRYELVILFDRNGYSGETLGTNEIAAGSSLTFVNGSQVSSNFGSQVWTYDNQSKPVDVVPSLGYDGTMGFSSINDPFDSSHDHRIYEFRIPLSLLQKSDRYGFSLQAHACSSQSLAAQCMSIYTLSWPSETIMSVPTSHGILELTGRSSVVQSVGLTLNNSQLILFGIIIAGVIAGMSGYMIIRKRKIST